MDIVNISGLDKADVLAALYNASQPLGLGFLDPRSQQPMTANRADEILAETPGGYFDYLQGRVMKVDLSGDDVRVRNYDRDNGQGAFARVIEQLRQTASA